jgi:hypothetical protein
MVRKLLENLIEGLQLFGRSVKKKPLEVEYIDNELYLTPYSSETKTTEQQLLREARSYY